MYKHIFFDLDRTFWDVETNQRAALDGVYHKFCMKTYYPDPVEFYWLFREINEKLWSQYSKGEIDGDYLRRYRFTYMFERLGRKRPELAAAMSRYYTETSPTFSALLPGSVEILDYLRAKGYPMSLVTNGFDRTQHTKLRHSGIDSYFKNVITSESSGFKKPQVEIFDYAMYKARVTAPESIMVGDDPCNDIYGGAQAGMDTVYYNISGAGSEHPPTYEIKELIELKNIL